MQMAETRMSINLFHRQFECLCKYERVATDRTDGNSQVSFIGKIRW